LAPGSARAAKLRKLAIIMGVDSNDRDANKRVHILRNELAQLGWIEAENLELRTVWAGGRAENAVRLTRDMVAWVPDVILAHNTISAQACFDHAKGIPVVFVSIFDAVGSGFVKSLAAPGTHMTGFINHSYELASKWVEYSRTMNPKARKIHLVWCPNTLPVGGHFYETTFGVAAHTFGFEPVAEPLNDTDSLRHLIDGLQPETDTLAVMADPFTSIHRHIIIERALNRRIVVVYPWFFFVKDGGLLSYGPDQDNMFKRSAGYLDKILRGKSADSLPVQAPVAFDLGLNVKTARDIGVEIPQMLLARATQIVD
jgi:putative ABC transport system substrate-binding protein